MVAYFIVLNSLLKDMLSFRKLSFILLLLAFGIKQSWVHAFWQFIAAAAVVVGVGVGVILSSGNGEYAWVSFFFLSQFGHVFKCSVVLHCK